MASYVFTFRRGTTAEWNYKNPVLRDGEPGIDTDKNNFKVGDGVNRWNALSYYIPELGVATTSVEDLQIALNNHVISKTPHPEYDDGPSLVLLYENAKV